MVTDIKTLKRMTKAALLTFTISMVKRNKQYEENIKLSEENLVHVRAELADAHQHIHRHKAEIADVKEFLDASREEVDRLITLVNVHESALATIYQLVSERSFK